MSTIESLDAQVTQGTDPLLEFIVNPSESLMYMCRIMGEFGNQTMNVHITLTVLPEEFEIASTATFGAAIAGVGTP